jgi:hypothetical protein
MKILPVLSLNYLQFSTRRHHKTGLHTTCWGVGIRQSLHRLRWINGFDSLTVRLNQLLQSIFTTAIHENLIVGDRGTSLDLLTKPVRGSDFLCNPRKSAPIGALARSWVRVWGAGGSD